MRRSRILARELGRSEGRTWHPDLCCRPCGRGVIFHCRRATACAMRALLPFMACLMVILTSWSGLAHAAEAAGGTFGAVAFTLHAPGDGDEVPADADQAAPHHHSICHGHDLGTPAVAHGPWLMAYSAVPERFARSTVLAGTQAGVRLRPPRA